MLSFQDRQYRWRVTDSTSTNHTSSRPRVAFSHHVSTGERTAPGHHYRHLTAPAAVTGTKAPSTERNRRQSVQERGSRSKYVPYSATAFRNLHSTDTDSDDISADHVSASTNQDMSVSELPPIGNRTGSAKSQRSSRDSSSGGQLTKASVVRYGKTPLLSVESNGLTQSEMMINRTATKRSHLSPGSNGSSSPSQQNGTSIQPCSTRAGMSRAKSWCATEANAGPSPRLETLFERNGITQDSNRQKHSSGQIVDRNSNIASKPPRARLRSQGPQTTSSSMLMGGRSLSNSISNISKASDINTANTSRLNTRNNTALQRNKSSLHNSQRFISEQNLSSLGNITSRTEARASKPGKYPPSRQQERTTSYSNFRENAKKSSLSQPMLNAMETNTLDESLTLQNLKNMTNDTCEVETSDSDSERDQRIKDWLMGVIQGETPGPQDVVEDPPKQTDTAIHIIYDKD